MRVGQETGAALRSLEGDLNRAPIAPVAVRAQARARNIVSTSSSNDRPAPWAILGSRLVGVIPGSVLISRMYSLPRSLTIRSTRVAP